MEVGGRGEKIKIAGWRREGLACAISWDFAQVITFSCATLQIDSGELLMTAKQPSTSAPPPSLPSFHRSITKLSYISLFSRNYEFDDILEIYVNLCFITEHLCLFSFFNHFVFNVVQIFQVLPSLTCKKIFQTCLRRNLVFFKVCCSL